MRKINTILSVLLLVIFMLHGLMGSFMLLGIGSSAGKILAWVGVAVLAAHTVKTHYAAVTGCSTFYSSFYKYPSTACIAWNHKL